MARSRSDRSPDRSPAKPPLRLRVPASLAVALLGASATVAMSFGGCQENTPDPVDAGSIAKQHDAGPDGSAPGDIDANDGSIADASDLDAQVDESPDAPVDARVDARVDAPPPDAPPT